jgi:hypothetical protein
MNSFPDPFASPLTLRRSRFVVMLFGVVLLLFALIYLKFAYDDKLDAQNSLKAAKEAEALLPSSPVRRVVAVVDAKQRAYRADLKATAMKLTVDWSARIASVEKAIGPDLALNAFRVDGQKGEIELKGETSSNAKLTSIVSSMQNNGLDARVGRIARFQNGSVSGLEYSILVEWPQ